MKFSPPFPGSAPAAGAGDSLLGELVGYLNENRSTLRAEWVRRATHGRLLSPLGRTEIEVIADALFEGYVTALAQNGLGGLREFLTQLPQFLRPLGVGGREAPGLASLLRDVCGRSLFRQFRHYEGRPSESSRSVSSHQPRWNSATLALQPT